MENEKFQSAAFLPPVVSREAQEQIYRLGKQLARCLAINGMLNSEVRVNTMGVQVFSTDCGRPFTDEEVTEIFHEPENHA